MWRKQYDYPIVVIGAGAAGLVVAIGAARAGKRVLLVEEGPYGGDCTNYGCIPSKATLAAAATLHSLEKLREYGIEATLAQSPSDALLKRTRAIVDRVRHHEEPEALAELGVDTLTGRATFLDRHTISVDGREVRGRHYVIATGSTPKVPPIAGIDDVPYLTNETLFALEALPQHLIVVGGGPIGCEMAQAFRRLGSAVTIVHRGSHLLARECLAAALVLEERFQKEGIALCLGLAPTAVRKSAAGITLTLENGNVVEGSHLLIAAGRQPNFASLGLPLAGVITHPGGIAVDAYGRTSRKHIWAVGDVAGRAFFTHLAENEARAVLTSLLLPAPFKKRLDRVQPLPRVTFCDPEIASFGLTEQHAFRMYGSQAIATYRVPLAEVDRAITAGEEEGFVEVVTKKWSSRIVGATIVAPRAGEMLMELATACYCRLPLRKLAGLIHPYPTYSLAIRKAADLWLTDTLLPALRRQQK